MRVIHKFTLTTDESPEILMTGRILKILHVGYQDESLCVWAEVDTGYGQSSAFYVLPTGKQVPDNLIHCGTVFSISGIFVWHVYVERTAVYDT